ncbi:hypothetical protein, partial [Klebsiella pneumoniae]|uniref:hypothetical protein n=1 Tax=Klebsiella pneumoniae TaxID=573 RepID=UPI0025A03068
IHRESNLYVERKWDQILPESAFYGIGIAVTICVAVGIAVVVVLYKKGKIGGVCCTHPKGHSFQAIGVPEVAVPSDRSSPSSITSIEESLLS